MRYIRPIASGTALLVLLVIVPIALVQLGHWPTWREVSAMPTEALTDTTAFAVLTLAAWAAWAVFAVSVAIELAVALRGTPRWRVPLATPLQSGARRLVAALTMSAGLAGPLSQRAVMVPLLPTAAHAATATDVTDAGPEPTQDGRTITVHTEATAPGGMDASAAPDSTTRPVADAGPARADAPGAIGDLGARTARQQQPAPVAEPLSAVPAAADLPTVTVQLGDSPWELAVQHLGDGLRWREVWELNRGAPQPDGRAWVVEDLIHIGWQLRLPVDAVGVGPPPQPAAPEDDTSAATCQDAPTATPPTEAGESTSTSIAPAPDGSPTATTPATASDDPAPQNDAADPGSNPSTNDSEGSAAPDDDTPVHDDQPATSGDDGNTNPTEDEHGQVGTRPELDERTTPSAADPGSDSETDDDAVLPASAPVLAGITGAVALATGLAVHLRRLWTRRATRGARTGRREGDDRQEAEGAVVGAADVPLVQWAAHQLGDLMATLRPGNVDGAPVAVEVSEHAGIELLWDTANPDAPDPWCAADGGWAWRLAYEPDAPLPHDEPCAALPALVTIGERDGRELLVDLEAYGSLAITGDPERVQDFARAVGLQLGVDDQLADAYVFLVDINIDADDHLPRLNVATADEALQRLRSTATSVEAALTESDTASSFEFRLGGQAHLETTVVLARSTEDDDLSALVDASPTHRGVATVLLGEAPNAAAHLTIDADGTAQLDPLGVSFRAAGVPPTTATEVANLLDPGPEADVPGTSGIGGRNGQDSGPVDTDETRTAGTDQLDLYAGTAAPDGADRYHENGQRRGEIDRPDATGGNGNQPANIPPARAAQAPTPDGPNRNGHHAAIDDDWTTPEPRLLVRVLGAPHIPDRPDLPRRQLTLAVYVACRGGPVKNSAVQNALWNGRAVSAKTLWNVIGRTRTALGHLDDGTPVMPPADRTNSTLWLSDGVMTDVAVLRTLYERSVVVSSTEAIELLHQGLDLVEGPPFDAPGYDWAHHTDQHVADASALIETVTERLVELALEAGQIDLAREAIVQGLRGLPGNEVLYRTRMRLEHDAGNPTAVKHAYEELTLFLADLDTEPADATAALYQQLSGHVPYATGSQRHHDGT